ncbi:MAG TPA: tyrosine-type recombinase/integrase [Spirochaetia bacterium]|nr:tyrosine-type recombinase/integrase [Spirochaetia bacterium]
MRGKGVRGGHDEALLAELEGIRDIYRLDVKQFIGFIRERKLLIVDGLRKYAQWLDGVHDGKRYSAATINRKLAAAKSRVRYAFKNSAFAADLRRKYQLAEILKSVKLKKLDELAVPTDKVLDVEEARKLAAQARDRTIGLMVTFLVRTGTRVSEMLGLRLTDLGPAQDGLVPIRVTGKGGKPRTIHVKAEFVERLKRHFEGSTWLFEHEGRRYNRVSVTNRIKLEALRTLGREVSAQQLRHTWAALQIKRGKSVRAVAVLLGHSNPGVTAQMYSEGELQPHEDFLDLEKTNEGKIG